MGVKISCEYLGDLRVKATHGPSGTVLHTDAPAQFIASYSFNTVYLIVYPDFGI